jgi:cation diffusion facilitator family transporter
MNRERQIIRASIVNIVGNVALAAVKGAAGIATGSVAITLDAVNSLTDALGSFIAIVGTKLAGRSADRDHPFGFGRMEYLTSIVIAAVILSAGVSSFIEAVRAIIHPTTPQYSFISLAVVAAAALVKFVLGAYLLRTGNRLSSSSLVGSGTDSFMDGTVSAATFAAGIVYLAFGLQVESLLAAGIALLIIRSGAVLLHSMTSKLMGERVSPDIASEVERETRAVDGVRFANGLVLIDFGPDQLNGIIHVTVDGDMKISEFDALAREVRAHVQESCGVTLAAVMPYPDASDSEDVRRVRATIGRIVWRNERVVELRGIYADPATQSARFDVVAAFDTDDHGLLRSQIEEACRKELPGWDIDARVLIDAAD